MYLLFKRKMCTMRETVTNIRVVFDHFPKDRLDTLQWRIYDSNSNRRIFGCDWLGLDRIELSFSGYAIKNMDACSKALVRYNNNPRGCYYRIDYSGIKIETDCPIDIESIDVCMHRYNMDVYITLADGRKVKNVRYRF